MCLQDLMLLAFLYIFFLCYSIQYSLVYSICEFVFVNVRPLFYLHQVEANRLYDRLDKARHHIKYRPNEPLGHDNLSEWWQYAIQCHIDHVHFKNCNANWSFVLRRSRAIVEYVDTYTKHLLNPHTLPTADRDIMESLESILGFTELKSLREIAMKRVEERTPKQTPTHTCTSPEPPSTRLPQSSSADRVSSPTEPTTSTATSVSSPSSPSQSSSASGETLLQRWFPSWAGWYNQPENTTTPASDTSTVDENEVSPLDITSSAEEENLSLYETPLASRKNSPPSSISEASTVDFPISSASSNAGSDVSWQTDRKRTKSGSLEEEFLYVLSDSMENNTFTKRDAVFCQLSFTLKQGIFTLSSEKFSESTLVLSELFKLEFSEVKMGLELRPRNKSYKLDIELGSLLLKEQVTKDSAFPCLVSPQSQSESSSSFHYRAGRSTSNPTSSLRFNFPYSRSASVSSRASSTIGAHSLSDSYAASGKTGGLPQHCINAKPIFSLSYEHYPANTHTDHRLNVVTQPLDLVYNPDAIDAGTNFFLLPLKTYSKHRHVFHNVPFTNLSMAARNQYNSLMEHTKQELRKNWNQIIQGGMRKRWAINLDISAPQFIIPEHFRDRSATLVVVDFGRLSFCSANIKKDSSREGSVVAHDVSQASKTKSSTWGGFMAKIMGHAPDDEDELDDEFATPCSTPDELGSDSDGSEPLTRPLTEELLHSHMYDKYELQLCDMQVLVGKVRDNWRFSFHRGTGSMHVVDRFSINVLVSRRIVSVVPDDRPWPIATLSATVPSIMLHLNQVKVQAFTTLINTISERSRSKSEDDAEFIVTPRLNDQFTSANMQDSYSEPPLLRSETASTLVSLSKDTFQEDSVPLRQSDGGSPSVNATRKNDGIRRDSADITESVSTMHDDSKLFVMQLNVDKLFIELVSRCRSIAEVQITGVKGIVQHRPHNYSASLTIHSLLVVDALQTFGADFQLLVASHKHISMDSVSGSLLDSEPCSPVSPASPDPNVPVSQHRRPTSPIILTKALHALATTPSQFNKKGTQSQKGGTPVFNRNLTSPPLLSSPPCGIDALEIDNEALISVEVTYVSELCPLQEGSGPLLMSTVQFNTIDIIANQETVVELVGFIHQLMSAQSSSSGSSVPLANANSSPATDSAQKRDYFSHSRSSSAPIDEGTPNQLGSQSVYSSLAMLYNPAVLENSFSPKGKTTPVNKEPLRVEMGFDFTKLSVLLLRAAKTDKEIIGRKVATAVMSQAKIQTTLANHQLSVEGSLGGFQVRDITPEPNKHQSIISVGQDIQIEKQQDIISRLTTGLYQSYAERENEANIKAFSFLVRRPLAFASSPSSDLNFDTQKSDNEKLTVTLQLASVVYTHSPNFMQEVSSCADEFKQYIARLAQSIKHAATEMAMGLVSKRIESFAVLPGYGTGNVSQTGAESPSHRHHSLARSTDTLHLPHPPPATASQASPTHSPPSDLSFRLKLSVVLETPILVFPESSNSSSVLVAQLGQISVKNLESSEPNMNFDQNAREDQYQNVKNPDCSAKGFYIFDDLGNEKTAYRDDDSVNRIVKYKIGVRDMSLYSLDIEERKARRGALSVTPSLRCAADLYGCGSDCSAIVHSTSIQVHLTHKRSPPLLPDSHVGMFVFPTDIYSAMDEEYSPVGSPVDSIEVTGGVVSAVKLSVSRQQYRQLVQTIANINAIKRTKLPTDHQHHSHLLHSIIEEDTLASLAGHKDGRNTSSNLQDLQDGPEVRASSTPSRGIDSGDQDSNKQPLTVRGEFTVPRVEVELVGDVNGCSQPLVNLILEEFRANYEDDQNHQTTTRVTLKSLVMEDLQCPESSPHRFLLRSVEPPTPVLPMQESRHTAEPRAVPPPFISTSCPDVKNMMEKAAYLSRSLPGRLELEKPYFKAQQRPTIRSSVRRRRKQFQQNTACSSMSLADVISEQMVASASGDIEADRKCPYTPPPSPIPDHSPQSPDTTPNLVRLNILNVDRKSKDFYTKYDGTDRFVDIAFNSLVAVVNIPSWVMMLDFFSAKQRRESSTLTNSNRDIPVMHNKLSDSLDNDVPFNESDSLSCTEEVEREPVDELNTIIEMSVVWLELVLVRVNGCGTVGAEVAGASVSDVSVRSVGSAGNLTLTGRLGSLAVTDRTPQGHRYKHKFVTSGTEALTFQLFQYGQPDPDMLRECDMRMNIKMSSVMYIHTQRFTIELMHVVQQFNELQAIVEKWRAIRAGQAVKDTARGARVSLCVSAGSPVIFLPLCGEGSDQVLVADLGSIVIGNKFMWAGAKGTISKIEREGLQERLSCTRATSRSRSRANRSRSRSIGRSRSRHNTTENTIATGKPPKCLLDVLHVTLTKIDLYTAKFVDGDLKSSEKRIYKDTIKTPSNAKESKSIPIPSTASSTKPSGSNYSPEPENGTPECEEVAWRFPGFCVRRQGHPLLREKCALTLQIERNLDTHVSRRIADVSVQGCVSKVHATIHEESYKLIRGLLQYNLGEDLTELHLQQQKLQHPHLPSHANIRQQPEEEDTHITLNIALDLDNVTVETLQTSSSLFEANASVKKNKYTPLACVNLIKSRLLYQSNSDGGNDVDLVSQEILLSDTRFQDCPVNKRSNVFTSILQPTPSNTTKNEGLLQAELHFRSTKQVTKFTILLNNMRLMGILEWWREVFNFIQLSSPNPHLYSSFLSPSTRAGMTRQTSDYRYANTKTTPHRCRSNASTPPFAPTTPNIEMTSPRSMSPSGFGLFGTSSNSGSRKSSGLGRNSPRLHPLVESTGVMTKHSLIDNISNDGYGYSDDNSSTFDEIPPFELKINITDSEIVIVEDAAQCNSSALILKVRFIRLMDLKFSCY